MINQDSFLVANKLANLDSINDKNCLQWTVTIITCPAGALHNLLHNPLRFKGAQFLCAPGLTLLTYCRSDGVGPVVNKEGVAYYNHLIDELIAKGTYLHSPELEECLLQSMWM